MSELDESDEDIAERFADFDFGDDAAIDSPDAPAAQHDAPSAPETAADDADTAARDDGRDALGRFKPKGADPAVSPDAPAANAAESAQPLTPGAPDPAAVDPAAVPEPPPEAGPLDIQPLVVNVGGREHAIPGAVVTPHGAVIPPESLQHLHEVYGRGIKYDAERGQIKAEKAQLHYERQAHQAQIAPVMAEIDQMFGMFRALKDAPNADAQAQAAEQILEYALNFATNEPLLKERMQFERERAEFQLQRDAQLPDPEQAAQQLRASVEATIQSEVQAYQQTDVGQLLTPTDWQRLEAHVHANPGQYLRRAGERLTQDEQANGVQPGELYWSHAAYDQAVRMLADVRREAKANETKHQQALTAATKAAAENAKRASAPKVQAPAVTKKPTRAPKPPADDDDEDLDDRLARAFADFR